MEDRRFENWECIFYPADLRLTVGEELRLHVNKAFEMGIPTEFTTTDLNHFANKKRGGLPKDKDAFEIIQYIKELNEKINLRSHFKKYPFKFPEIFLVDKKLFCYKNFNEDIYSFFTYLDGEQRSKYPTLSEKKLKKLIIDHSGGVCQCCFKKAYIKENGLPALEVHRLLPGEQGGRYIPENSVATCEECHGKLTKGDLTWRIETTLRLYKEVLKRVLPVTKKIF